MKYFHSFWKLFEMHFNAGIQKEQTIEQRVQDS